MILAVGDLQQSSGSLGGGAAVLCGRLGRPLDGELGGDGVVSGGNGLDGHGILPGDFGAPLGHDYCVLSLSDRLKPWDVIAGRLSAAAKADLAIAIYNPRSGARPWQVGAARDALLEHRAADTPVVLGRDVGGAGERVTVTTLGELDPEQVDMRTLVIVGSSRTRVVTRAGRPAVFTPRSYPSVSA